MEFNKEVVINIYWQYNKEKYSYYMAQDLS